MFQCSNALRQVDCNPAAMAAASKVKLVRKAQVDDRMEVDGNEHRQSSNLEAVHAQSPSVIQVLPVLSNTTASLKPPPAFKMAQELIFALLAHAFMSKCANPNSYVMILVSPYFRQSFSIQKALGHLSEPYPGQTWLHSLVVKVHKYSIIHRATNSVRAASCQRTGPSVGWCGLGSSLNVDSGTAVR